MSRATSFEAQTANYGFPDTFTAYYENPVVSGANDDLPLLIHSSWSDTTPSPTTPGTPQTPIPTSVVGCPYSADSTCEINVPYADYEIRGHNTSLLVPRHTGQGIEWSDKFLTFGVNSGDPPHLSQVTDSIYHERPPFEFTQWDGSLHDATSSKSADGAVRIATHHTDFGCERSLQNVATKEETIDTADLFALVTPGSEQGVWATVADVQYQPAEEFGLVESTRIRPVGSDALSYASMKRRERIASYFCTLCSATFTAKHNLKSECSRVPFRACVYNITCRLDHMNSHRGIRPHMCQGCRRTFGTKHVLTRHEGTCGFFRNRRRGHWNASR